MMVFTSKEDADEFVETLKAEASNSKGWELVEEVKERSLTRGSGTRQTHEKF